MYRTKLKSFAKINVGLRILKKREDGFHDLETIYYPVKLHDEITIQIEPSKSNLNSVILKSNKPYIPLTKDNLCYKAIENFFKVFKIRECYKISLDVKKNIPVGGGLGGGSSNAATILKFLIKFLNIDIESNRRKILDIALSIGSDVPFFIMLKPCYAEGRGEIMELLHNFVLDYDILIVNANLHVSTKWAFERLNLKSAVKEPLLKKIKTFDPENREIFVNDFEELIFKKHEVLREIKEEMSGMGAVYASMSGSGATMYGLFEKNKNGSLDNCRDYFNKKKYFTFVSD